MLRRLGFAAIAAAIVVLGLSAGTTLAKSNQIKFSFMNTGLQPQASGKIQVMLNRAQSTFTIKVHRAQPGLYRVLLNGAVVDMLSVRTNGEGKIVRRLPGSSRNGNRRIPIASFDPRGEELQLQLQGATVLTADVPETPDDSKDKVLITTELMNLGVVPGTALAEFQTVQGHMKFEVELFNGPVGTYEVLVGGVLVGTMTTGVDGVRAKLELDSRCSGEDDDGEGGHGDGSSHQGDDDDQGEDDDDHDGDDDGNHDGDDDDVDDDDDMDCLLTFDPRGMEIVIQQNGVALFSATLPLIQ